MSAFSSQHSGDISTTDYRVFAKQGENFISYFHDVPLYVNEEKTILNMVVEIPKGTNAKMEISVNEEGNPIKQDVKNGKLRFVDNVFPYTGYIWNYGALPQTWEDPTHKHPDTECFGDNDPLDACEIGSAVGVRGEVKQVKALGIMALIDEGETDWKVIVIDVNDPRADEFNDISDVQRLMPGFTMATYEWFRTYKMPAGKPANEFAFNGEAKGRDYTMNVIAENYNFWKRVISGEIPSKADKYDVASANVTCEGSPHKVDSLNVTLKDVADMPDAKAPEPAPAPANIKVIVEQQQINCPHGTATLSAVIQGLAAASARAVEEGAAGLEAALKEQVLAAVFQEGNDTPIATNETGHYTVYYHAKDQVAVFGVYQKSTPHRTEFSLANEVTAAGYDLVAAAFASNGVFTFTTGHGTVSFSAGGVVDTASAPSVNSDSLLAVKAPLAFLS